MTAVEISPIAAAPSTITPLPVVVPSYDTSGLIPAVVHIGVGGFHRAHQAVYFDDLAALGHRGWGVIGVGISRPRMGEVLAEQGNLFTVVQRGANGSTARVIGVLTDYLLLATQPDRVRAALADPRIRLVTLTITGDGYVLDGCGSVFELVVDALDARRRAGTPPFTVLSCDNLPDAGGAARSATLTLAAARSAELATWIAERVTFPSSMVDRITPTTSPDEVALVGAEFGVCDRWPVITEPFAQWVIEDAFCNGRPPLDEVGVRFVDDVRPYKLIKSRMLNGGHCALGYLGLLAGYRTTAEAMADPDIARFMAELLTEEIAPLLPSDVPGMELGVYVRELLDRFGNAAIGDQLSRLCRRGSTKMPDYLLPSLDEARVAGRQRRLLMLALAAWLQYLQGVDAAGDAIVVDDARADELRPLAVAARTDPSALLSMPAIFGELGRDENITAVLPRLLDTIAGDGVQAAIRMVSTP
jgi:mannitol-1-phosphate/altronate dehydrogenase